MLAFARDGDVHPPRAAARNGALSVGAAALLLLWAVRLVAARLPVTVSLVEVLLAAGLAWGLVTDPAWAGNSTMAGFGAQAALLAVVFLTRQIGSVGTVRGKGRTSSSSAGDPRGRLRGMHGGVLHAVWVCAAVEALIGIGQRFGSSATRAGSEAVKTVVVGTLEAPNAFGALMGAGALAALASAWMEDGWGRRLPLAGFGLATLALVLNGSRGAALGVLAGILVVSWALWVRRMGGWGEPRARWKQAGAVVGLAAAVMAGAWGLHRLAPESGRGRLMVWGIATRMVGDHPVTGVGAARFEVAYPAYQATYFENPENLRWAHKATYLVHAQNTYLTTMAERGIPGGLLFLAPWLVAGLGLARSPSPPGEGREVEEVGDGEGVRRRRARLGLLAVLAALVVHMTVDGILLVPVVALLAHAVLGLAPAPSVTFRPSGTRDDRAWVAAGAAVAAIVLAWPVVRGYPARRSWLEGLREERPQQAVQLLQQARERLPGEGALAFHLGRELLRAGLPEAAAAELERALQHRREPDVRLTLASALLAARDTAGARLHADSARAVYPDRIGPHLMAAQIHRAAGRDAAARRALARCIRRDTRIRSDAVEAVAERAEVLWRAWYDDPPPAVPDTPGQPDTEASPTPTDPADAGASRDPSRP